MRIQSSIPNTGGRYQPQIRVLELTHAEEEKIAEFGEPLVDVGGDFTGTVARPNQTNTTVSFSSGAAAATPIIDAYGVITGFTVTNGGTGYGSAPAVTINGDGTGATATAVLTSGVVTSITVVTGGIGYHVTPVTVSFSLPARPKRLKSEFPVKEVFDLADNAAADVMAKIWVDTVEARLVTAKLALLSKVSPLVQDTIKNV